METIVYGARCVWWDSIDKAELLPSNDEMPGLPCCPHCRGVLFQVDEADWSAAVKKHEEEHAGYGKFLEWLRGKCFPTQATAQAAFEREEQK